MITPPAVLPIGDPARVAAIRALGLMSVAVTTFIAFTVLTTQAHTVRAGSPWQNDPYDALFSFTDLFVPILAALAVARALLYRPGEPVPVARLDGLLRTAKAAAVLIAATVLTDGVALALRADHRLWNDVTIVSIAAWTSVAVTLGAAAVPLWRAHRELRERVAAAEREDWLADLPLLASRLTPWVPSRVRRAVLHAAERVARWPLLPGHLPGLIGATVLLLGGVTRATLQAVQEGQRVTLFAFEALLTAATTYAGLVIVNSYLHIAAVRRPSTPAGRAARGAFVLGCLTLLVAGGLRDPIWRALGLGHDVNTIAQLWLVTFGGAAIVAAVAVPALLTVYARHPPKADRATTVPATRRSR